MSSGRFSRVQLCLDPRCRCTVVAMFAVIVVVEVRTECLVENSPWAQMTCLALFRPVVTVVACVEPYRTFREFVVPM